MWYNSTATLLLFFECVNQVYMKYHVFTKIVECKIFSQRFDYVDRDILQAGNTTAESKYNLDEN